MTYTTNKISQILTDDFPTSESVVVHFFVEVRKIIESMNKSEQEKFSLIKFYGDWLSHTQKDRIPESIKVIMGKIDQAVPTIEYLNEHQNMWAEYLKFVYMDELREELRNLFDRVNLPKDFINDNIRWLNFAHFLITALIDQPIIDPVPSINRFAFLWVKDNAVIWEIIFNDDRKTFKCSNVIH